MLSLVALTTTPHRRARLRGYRRIRLEQRRAEGRSHSRGHHHLRTPESITLRQALGVEENIQRANIKSLTASEHSLMPAGLEATMKPQDLADLLSFFKGGAQCGAGASSFGVKRQKSKVGRWAPRSGAAMSRRATTFRTRLRRAQPLTSNVQRLTFNEGCRRKSARHHTALAYNASSYLFSKIP